VVEVPAPPNSRLHWSRHAQMRMAMDVQTLTRFFMFVYLVFNVVPYVALLIVG
jgi:hypothetical protein